MEKIRVAVVGLGHRGRHMALLAAESFEYVDLIAACDIDPQLWSEKQWLQPVPLKDKLPTTRFYEDYEQMLDECKPDIILVETGANVHADFCIKALNRNIHVFSDIPSVYTLDEARKLWDAEQASSAQLMTGANPNEWGFVNALVDLYRRGLIGEPYYMEAEYIHSIFPDSDEVKNLFVQNSWRKVFAPIRYCTHSLGPLLRILKEDLRYAICLGTGPKVDPADTRDSMQAALFQTESGVTVRLLRNGRCYARIGHHSYRVFGSKGYFERLDGRGKQSPSVHFTSTEMPGAAIPSELNVDMMPPEYYGRSKAVGHGGADYALFDHMFKAYLSKEPFPISLRDGLRMTLPGIYAAESALRQGEKLTIHYPWEEEFISDIEKYNI